jgi:MSHA pilin protein MshD
MTGQRGVTLVELLVSILIVSIAASAVLGVLAMTTAASADPMIRHQAAAIAEAYLEEVLLKPLVDPDGVDGEAARADFDDLDDYDGLSDAGAHDQFGNALAGLDAYNVAVNVTPTSALPAIPVADALRVDIVVSHGSDINFALSGYRTRF